MSSDASLNLFVSIFMVKLSNYIFIRPVYRSFKIFSGMHEVPAIINEYRFRKWQIFFFLTAFFSTRFNLQKITMFEH